MKNPPHTLLAVAALGATLSFAHAAPSNATYDVGGDASIYDQSGRWTGKMTPDNVPIEVTGFVDAVPDGQVHAVYQGHHVRFDASSVFITMPDGCVEKLNAYRGGFRCPKAVAHTLAVAAKVRDERRQQAIEQTIHPKTDPRSYLFSR